MKLNTFKFASYIILVMFFIQNNANAVVGVNSAATVLCDVISLLRGRIGRAITMFAILGLAVTFVMGNISWQKLMMVSVGMGIFYAAESIAFVILPSVVTGVSGTLANGTVFNPNKKYTPQFILQNVCPELGMFSGTSSSKYSGGSQTLPGVRQAQQTPNVIKK
jgi:type IV secretory pathway VirB2 component (pilin)